MVVFDHAPVRYGRYFTHALHLVDSASYAKAWYVIVQRDHRVMW